MQLLFLSVLFGLGFEGTLQGETSESAATPLPPLRIRGVEVRAHVQGMDWSGSNLYVTARRDDVVPRRALLLRTGPNRSDWDVWDITRKQIGGSDTILDHPGGFQISKGILWVPIAQSSRGGHSQIHAYRLASLSTNRFAKPELTFAVDDHIGALAVEEKQKLLLGATWDTERVFVWNYQGTLQRIITLGELSPLGLGSNPNVPGSSGLAVQDWKFSGGRLHASGLLKGELDPAPVSRSRLIVFEDFLASSLRKQILPLRPVNGVEMGREGFALKKDYAYFLPEDLGPTNRLFRAKLPSSLDAPSPSAKP